MAQDRFPRWLSVVIEGELHVFEYEGSRTVNGERRYTSQTTRTEAWIDWRMRDRNGQNIEEEEG